MNIIKVGKQFPYKGTCETCGSELECTKAEVRNIQTGMNQFEQVAACPVCLERGQITDVVFEDK